MSRQTGEWRKGHHGGRGVETVRIRADQGDEIKCVSKFKYLGTTIRADGVMNTEIERRIGICNAVMNSLSRIWNSNSTPRKIKSSLFDALILSILLYN